MQRTALSALACLAMAQGEDRVEYKPLQIGAFHEFGSVVKGIYQAGGGSAQEKEAEWIDHLGASLTAEAVVNERWIVAAGLGGVFQFRKPETVGAGFDYHQRKGFFNGPTRSEILYLFGDVDDPWLKLGVGAFGYKYNPDAGNLGEYLFRSGPYPTVLMTGGYTIIGNAGAGLQGAKANFKAGNLQADLFLLTETTIAPLYDFSLAGVVGYSFGEGLFDIGAGVNLKRIFPVRPSRTQTKSIENGYVTLGGEEYSTNSGYYAAQADFYAFAADSATARGDAAAAAAYTAKSEAAAAKRDIVDTWIGETFASPETAAKPEYYTHTGILLMGRASLHVGRLLDAEWVGETGLKLFAEAAVLGVQNYPVFYEKMSERMPVMFGMNLPTFGWFDLITVQGEYLKTSWMNNTYKVGVSALAVPYYAGASDEFMSQKEYMDAAGENSLKWSMLAKKSFGRLTFSVQAANDHLKLVSSRFYYGPQFDHNEITAAPDHWHWMTQISWGL